MTTRLIALALAAAGLSAGGFQLGARQAPAAPPTSEPVLDRLPADHALTVALRDSSSHVTQTERERLRRLAVEMEVQKKEAEQRRVQALDTQIQELQRKLVAQQSKLAMQQAEIELKHVKLGAKKVIPKSAKQMQEVEIQVKLVRDRLMAKEVAHARSMVERKFEDLTISTLGPEARDRVTNEVRAIRAEESERGFALLIALRERDALKLTPGQVTQLQLLQSEFIRRFAPLREESETQAVIELKAVKEKLDVVTKDRFVPAKSATVEFKGKADVTVTDTFTSVKEVPVLGQVPIVGRLFRVDTKETKDIPLRIVSKVIFVGNEDVSKRIQDLKNEIDDKAFEILNDDQQKRLRRMVAISLSGSQP